MDKEDVVQIYTTECYPAAKKKKNEAMPFVATWIQLRLIILSEVRNGNDINYMWNL